MPTFTDLLPPTRTHEHRSIQWTPCPADAGCACSGVVEVTCQKTRGGKPTTRRYAVAEVPAGAGFDGRAFRFVKPGGEETRNVFLAADRHLSTCDCEGWTYAATSRADHKAGAAFSDSLGCCHLDSAAAVVDNRWLDHPLDRPAESEDDPAPTMADLDAAIEAAGRERVGGFDICPACRELGLFEFEGDHVCCVCNEVFPAGQPLPDLAEA